MKVQIQLIKWDDAYSEGGWRSKEQMAAVEPATSLTVGFPVKRDRKKVTVAQNRGLTHDNIRGDSMTIPKGCVIKVYPITVEIDD